MSWLWILLAAVAQPVMIIHSSPALLISQCYKLSHESLCIDPVIACVFSKVSWCLGKTESCEKKILANFHDNIALYFNILPKDCLQTDHTIKLSLFNNLTIRFFLFIYWVIYIFIYLPINSSFLFSSSRINQCYELLRYIWVLISSFINQLFVFTFKLLGILLLRYH